MPNEPHIYTLDNGMRIGLQPTESPKLSGLLKVRQAMMHEGPEEDGLSHLLEHVLAKELKQPHAVDGGFCKSYASTAQAYTRFSVDTLCEDTADFIEQASQVTLEPRLDPATVHQEQQVVAREIADNKSSQMLEVQRRIRELLYAHQLPHSTAEGGNENIITQVSPEELRRYHQRGYHPANMDILLAGGLPENIEELIEQKFGQYTGFESNPTEVGSCRRHSSPQVLHLPAPGLCNPEEPEQSTAYFTLYLPAPARQDPDAAATFVMTMLLGGGQESYLFRRVREQEHLAYAVQARNTSDASHGMITVEAKVPAQRISDAGKAIFEEMGRLCQEPVSEAALAPIKKDARHNIATTYENCNGMVYAMDLYLETGKTPLTELEQIRQTTPKDIQHAAQNYLPVDPQKDGYVLVVQDPLKENE